MERFATFLRDNLPIGAVAVAAVMVGSYAVTGGPFWPALLLPALIAQWRLHHNRLAISVLSFVLFGLCWTATIVRSPAPIIVEGFELMFGTTVLLSLVGWLVALVWSCTAR